MTKPEEVIAWAEETRAGNGEAFTMLKKEEQLLIAQFILAMRDHIKMLKSTIKMLQSTKEDAPPLPPEAEKPQDEEKEDEGVVVDDPPDPTLKQTNMEYFKANNISMQRAFQLYQTWANVDPSNRIIMDEERKAHIKSASFAFWLNLPHE